MTFPLIQNNSCTESDDQWGFTIYKNQYMTRFNNTYEVNANASL